MGTWSSSYSSATRSALLLRCSHLARQYTRISLNEQTLYISPVVRLELQNLWETQRVTDDADTIVADLTTRIGLRVCDKEFNDIVTKALTLSWTRDPFDRLIVATLLFLGPSTAPIITADGGWIGVAGPALGQL